MLSISIWAKASVFITNNIYKNMENFRITEDLMASQGQRFLNYIIDLIVQVVLYIILELIIILIFGIFGITGIADYFANTNRIEDYLIGSVLALIYYIPMESFFSRSIGKYITGTIVVMEDGSKPDSQSILKRSFWRIVPFDIFSFLGTPCHGWHDSKSETFVVNKADFERKRELFYDFEQIGKEKDN
jgi:uncharacterized RDD family membrane protein YckC